MKNKFYLGKDSFVGLSLAAAMAAFTFTACGDDSSSGKEDGNQSAFKEVDSVD